MTRTVLLLGVTAGLVAAVPAAAQTPRGFGVRAGLGTDISLGIAGGVEINYGRPVGTGRAEFGLMLFGGSFSEESVDEDFASVGCCRYREETNVFVAAALANYLFGYGTSGPYFVGGFGVGLISISWREESPDDTSLGPQLPGGGSVDEEDGTVGGTVLNLGVGTRLSPRVDIRAQVPLFITVAESPGDNSVIPTFAITLGYRF